MTPAKGKFKSGEAYVAFSRVRTLEKLHIINYTQSHIHVSEHVEKYMQRLRKNILPPMPSNLFHDVPGGVKLVHINIRNFNRKIADMKNDDIFQNADIILLNETHLGHSETLTPDMMQMTSIRCAPTYSSHYENCILFLTFFAIYPHFLRSLIYHICI